MLRSERLRTIISSRTTLLSEDREIGKTLTARALIVRLARLESLVNGLEGIIGRIRVALHRGRG